MVFYILKIKSNTRKESRRINNMAELMGIGLFVGIVLLIALGLMAIGLN
jgi:hypothetical protein